jgi:hypothetical protein
MSETDTTLDSRIVKLLGFGVGVAVTVHVGQVVLGELQTALKECTPACEVGAPPPLPLWGFVVAGALIALPFILSALGVYPGTHQRPDAGDDS